MANVWWLLGVFALSSGGTLAISGYVRRRRAPTKPSPAPFSAPDRQQYLLYRDQIASEANWVSTRTNWLLTANAFLATAMAIVSTSAHTVGASEKMYHYLPTVGVVVNAGTLLMLIAAERVTVKLWQRYSSEYESEGLPHLLGHPWAHFVGIAVPMGFALGAGVAWCLLGQPAN